MSTDQTEAADICCASCGVAEVDEIKLMDCDACDLVRYCSDECKKDHRLKHETNCKERAAELRDEILFRQPQSSFIGDCPICFLPLPLDPKKSSMQSCCSKLVCKGCSYADYQRQLKERLGRVCPFCRHPTPTTQEEANKNTMKRAAANDPVAIHKMAWKHCHEGDYVGAFEYWTKAAELGDVEAHHELSIMYQEGLGVEKDEIKKVYHLEKAAIGGHPEPRYDLAVYEWENKRFDRSAKHFIIAANLGHDDSLQQLKKCYAVGSLSKEDFAAALRAHQAAVDATKSPQREAAAKAETGLPLM